MAERTDLPPHSLESEQGVLGCILADATAAMDDVLEVISNDSSAFYDLRHRKLFERLLSMYDASQPIDLLTVRQRLVDGGELEAVGGYEYISKLVDSVPSASNAGWYAKTLRDKHLLRKTVKLCVDTAARARDNVPNAEALVDDFESAAFRIRDHTTSKILTVKDVARQSIDRLDTRTANRGKLGGLPSGFIDLDKMSDGFRGGEMIVIAARPSGGKTAMGLNMLDVVCVQNKKPSAIFSLEMTSRALMDRLICGHGRIDASAYRRGELSEAEMKKAVVSISAIGQAPLTFIEADGMTISDVRRTARRLRRQGLLDFVILDYIQLVRATRMQEKKTYELAEVSTGLKQMAKELDIPVIALAQLNRKVDDMGRTRRPRASDIRDCGQIEQDADFVGLLHTEEKQPNPDEFFNVTLIIGKQREGETGDVGLLFHRRYTRFDNAARYMPPSDAPRAWEA